MPVSAGSPSSQTVPSFVSIYGGEAAAHARLRGGPVPSSPLRDPHASSSRHLADGGDRARRDSTATAKSESADSSPTTTISTTDSILTGSSPSSSPESPTSSLPMNSFAAAKSPSVADGHVSTPSSNPLVSPSSGFDSDSPGRRPRNVRNLSINTRGISTRPTTAAAPNGSDLSASSVPAAEPAPPANGAARALATSVSEPASPSFIASHPRKSKSKLGLTIAPLENAKQQTVPNTPGFASMSFATRRQTGSIPETPALKRFPTLRETEEVVFSPSDQPAGGMSFPQHKPVDPSLPTPAMGPAGGMTLPPLVGRDPSPQRPPSRPALSLSNKQSFEGGAGSSVIHHTVEHTPDEPQHELPLSREVKSPSYPNGPACIYSPGVYLYHQPTANEAREFDVVINVAKEVPNPFEEEAEALKKAQEDKGYVDVGVQCSLLPAPPLKLLPPLDEEPETPKASSPTSKLPEYIHLPWEHNSHVYEDWLSICELIDSRAKSGKKVLIHCQLGVSRSASLIVAYGLYLNPSLTPDEARELAKKQSKWIDLNMHFMYELGDFKKILQRKFPEPSFSGSGAGPMLGRTKTESFLPSSFMGHDLKEEDESRRASIADPSCVSRDEPSSAPADANWSPTEPSLHEDSFDKPEPEDSSDVPTPVRAEAEASEPPKEPSAIAAPKPEKSPLVAAQVNDPAKDLSRLSLLQAPESVFESPVQPLPAPPAEPSDLAPARRLRPAPSMPAGFRSIRKVSPALSLNTEAAIKPVTNPSGAPELPPLDFGSSLMSPRTSAFVANPFHRNSLAGDLAGLEGLDGLLSANVGGAGASNPNAPALDPRSPPQRGEHPITRNIDDVL